MAKKKKIKLDWKGQVLMIFGVILAVVIHPTTVLLLVGMLPTLVVAAFDRAAGKAKTLIIGAMNLAGCSPFVFELWMKGHTLDVAIHYISEPRTIVIMYFAAAIGYLIDWSLTGIVASVMIQKGRARLAEIDKIQEELIQRWGKEVSGRLVLDEYGFPIEQQPIPVQEDGEEDV